MSAAVGLTLGFSTDLQGFPRLEPPWFGNGTWNSHDRAWWHNTLHEAGIAQADFIAPVTRSENPRGDNPGWSSPLRLTHLVDVVKAAVAGEPGAAIEAGKRVPLLAPFVDTGAHPWTWTHVKTGAFEQGEVNLGEADAWELFWKHDLAHFFNTVPKDLLFTIDGRVLVTFWSIGPGSGYSNQEGNLSRLLERLREAARDEHQCELFVVCDKSWPALDSTLTSEHCEGVNDWFDPPGHFSVRQWSGQAFGMAVPGFVDPSNPARRIDRRDGAALREAFDAFDAARTRVVLLEGLTDWEECAGFYRSDAWTYREQYLDIVRERGDRLRALTTT